MTWHRFDENTYIDDTLVTCAEYQLFIDEMREQGKYHQPDHWTSYQFLAGQAREPVLGVRHSDAVAFCEWLTKRGNGEWSFRVPINAEVQELSLMGFVQSPLGCWIIRSDNEEQFSYIGPAPINPRKIGIASEPNLELSSDEERAYYIERALKIEMGCSYDGSDIIDTSYNLAMKLPRALDRALDLELAIDLAFDIKNLYGITPHIEFALELAGVRNNALDRDLDLDRAMSLARAFHQSSSIVAIDGSRRRNGRPIGGPSRAHQRAQTRALYQSMYLLLDLLTLKERIAGRSPAFEGIRLVKERIR